MLVLVDLRLGVPMLSLALRRRPAASLKLLLMSRG
uniref:Uncharacterized protein n=1 Tax=Parascaris equorum TaxID=6256 RepID=A0A914RZQ4_PAREQ